jgi:hypothetical protein
MKTQKQLESTVAHLNQIVEEKSPTFYYVLSPITGTDNYALWLSGPKDDHKICVSDSTTLYQSIAALKNAHRII